MRLAQLALAGRPRFRLVAGASGLTVGLEIGEAVGPALRFPIEGPES